MLQPHCVVPLLVFGCLPGVFGVKFIGGTFVFWVVFKGVFVRAGVLCGNRFPLCCFFPPPELISASRTGLLVNNILPIQKKK
jgi:hypothetical protein